jgi:uncharacterized protein
MIVSLSVSNFRSFASEETLSLVASKRLSASHERHATPIPDSDERVLRTGVLYGANGAGKSNLFKALRYLRSVALEPGKNRNGTDREAFRFGGEEDQPSGFDLQFIAGGRLYRFGFKADDQRIAQEWLARVEGARQKIIYQRVTSESGQVEISGAGLKAGGRKVEALATIGGQPYQSFLATIHATLQLSDLGKDLAAVLTWFKTSLQLIAPDQPFRSLAHILSQSPDLLEFSGAFLKSASTGIDHLNVSKTEVSEDELRGLLPDSFFSKALADLWDNEDGAALIPLGEGNDLLIERKGGNRNYLIKIRAAHENRSGGMIPLELSQESDGTQRLMQLIPALHHLRTNSAVYFIDEIDRSLHPMLVRAFLEAFLKSGGGQGQIIVTTHESSLLDQDLLRRDEIWFAEKDDSGATRLYSLIDFKVRNDLEIRKHYLQGRFGAVPFLGSLDRLVEEQGQPR